VKKTHDYIHPYRSYWSDGRKCRIRIYRGERRVPVVICSQLTDNDNTSVTNMVEYLAAEVIREHNLPTPLVWVEHYPQHAGEILKVLYDPLCLRCHFNTTLYAHLMQVLLNPHLRHLGSINPALDRVLRARSTPTPTRTSPAPLPHPFLRRLGFFQGSCSSSLGEFPRFLCRTPGSIHALGR
jgi:hypothetical protein